MRHTRIYLFILGSCMVAWCNPLHAQFAKGTRMIGASIGASYTDDHNSELDVWRSLNNKRISTDHDYIIGLSYGKFKKDNMLLNAGISYEFAYNLLQRSTNDTAAAYAESNDRQTIHHVTINGGSAWYYPVWTTVGFYHAEAVSVGYSHTTSEATDLTPSGISSHYKVPGSQSIGTGAGFNLGAYYMVTPRLMLLAELKLIQVALSYKWEKSVSGTRQINDHSFAISTTGTLTPNYKLSDVSIGIRYVIPAKTAVQR